MAFEPFLKIFKGIQSRQSLIGISETQNLQQMAYLRNLQQQMLNENVMYVPLDELKVVVFDIETTGFYPERGDRILSIGATKMHGKKILEQELYYSLVFSDLPVPKEVEELTGITAEDTKVASPLSDVLIKFFQFIGNTPLVAHHSNHERSFMQHFCNKLFKTSFKHRIVDTSFLLKIVEPNFQKYTLDELCNYHHIPIENRHHALGDAKMTAEIWGIYIDKVQMLGCKTLHDVYHRFASL
ncbi:exonuclease domain-containing protein [Ureibacillus acetophenoni]|uniref:DNA polymerase-3 subunit epsilon n=1 Tax=Ureibacillus acetophenoni TaxID=614649 RepID=A0A285U234_9BACL|nr:exonuclease domain-containing protein [Ureibacillus acetophenoni]SOC36020.1 DNA polymerase-3 subunit epsilon [Ureibacillus acetophenoni]